ncbi:enoyl-CoA hydratase/isomerase family protein [Microbacterium sp. X-17]|uniref:enoyl-CoA hydratase/isomerase family protein n=1 Tax=Microbacterium sp. X-17 TaxID=3144404 RepID=UPI0031F4866C
MSEELDVTADGLVAVVEVRRGAHNFFDEASLRELGDALVELDADPRVRVVVLGAAGRSFCAGADLRGVDPHLLRRVYREAFRIFTTRTPVVAALHGAVVGGGLGLALAADFRVAGPDVRMTANFARLGFHHGFGLSVTLPETVGRQCATDLLYSGRNVAQDEALAIGLVDRAADDPRAEAVAWAHELAGSSRASLQAIRSTMRRDLLGRVAAALDVEATAQTALLGTPDFAEGVAAAIEKRAPVFTD